MKYHSDGFTFVVDPITLRDACTEPERLSRFCDAHPESAATVAYLRIVGRLDEAEARGREAVARATTPLHRSAALARLAHVLQWQDRQAEALALFDEALACPGVDQRPRHGAQLLVHRAKCRLAAGDAKEAERDATTALGLLSLGKTDETESARMVLARVAKTGAPSTAPAPSDRIRWE